MKVYSVRATLGAEVIQHQRLSITKALPIARELVQDGWCVTVEPAGEWLHPWRALPAVTPKRRRAR